MSRRKNPAMATFLVLFLGQVISSSFFFTPAWGGANDDGTPPAGGTVGTRETWRTPGTRGTRDDPGGGSGTPLHPAWDDPGVHDPASYEAVMDAIDGWQDPVTGRFDACLTPSLEATYYALYGLSSIGSLGEVNASLVTSYVLSRYDPAVGAFRDEYALARGRVDFPGYSQLIAGYPPVRATAYGALSLSILGEIASIDGEAVAGYLASCQDPASGGFLDSPGDSSNPAELANSYFAVRALVALGGEWRVNTATLGAFVDSLTYKGSSSTYLDGSFGNEIDGDLVSLQSREYSHETAYYALYLMDFCGNLAELSGDYWSNFLPTTHEPSSGGFGLKFEFPVLDRYDAAGTGWALAEVPLAAPTNPQEAAKYDLDAAANYLLTLFDDSRGLWKAGNGGGRTWDPYFTFAALVGLNESGRVGWINASRSDALAGNLTSLFAPVLLPSGAVGLGATVVERELGDISSTASIAGVLASNYEVDRVNATAAYEAISSAYVVGAYGDEYFHESPYLSEAFLTLPLEWAEGWFDGGGNFSGGFPGVVGTGKSLLALLRLNKLDEFNNEVRSLSGLRDHLKGTQIDNASMYSHGGFVELASEEDKINGVYWYYEPYYAGFEATVWAVEALACIKAQLTGQVFQLGSVVLDSSYLQDPDALASFVNRARVENSTSLWFEPRWSACTSPVVDTWRSLRLLFRAGELESTMSPADRVKVWNFLSGSLPGASVEELAAAHATCELLGLGTDDLFSGLPRGRVRQLVGDCYCPAPQGYLPGYASSRGRVDFGVMDWFSEFRGDNGTSFAATCPATAGYGEDIVLNVTGFNPWEGTQRLVSATCTSTALLGGDLELEPEGSTGNFTGTFTVPVNASLEGANNLTVRGRDAAGQVYEVTLALEVVNNLAEHYPVAGGELPANGSEISVLDPSFEFRVRAGFALAGGTEPDTTTRVTLFSADGNLTGSFTYLGIDGSGMGVYSLAPDLSGYEGSDLSVWIEVGSDFADNHTLVGNYSVPVVQVILDDAWLVATGQSVVRGTPIQLEVGVQLTCGGYRIPMSSGNVEFRVADLETVALVPKGGSPYANYTLDGYDVSNLTPGTYSAVLTVTREGGSPVSFTYQFEVLPEPETPADGATEDGSSNGAPGSGSSDFPGWGGPADVVALGVASPVFLVGGAVALVGGTLSYAKRRRGTTESVAKRGE
ncbi:MAG: prenyltransferase/squalene oxidase repeat-containing protein [Promethearchaeota archaeon]